MGIDRDAINEIVFLGISAPARLSWQKHRPSILVQNIASGQPGYRKSHARHGLDKKDADGFRLRTDNGERLVLEIDPIRALSTSPDLGGQED